MTSKAPSPLTKNIQLTHANIDLIKAEAAKSHRSAREWLNMYITATFPLPDTYILEAAYKRATLGHTAPTPDHAQNAKPAQPDIYPSHNPQPKPRPQPMTNLEANNAPLYSDPELEARRLATLAEWNSPDEDD